MVRFYWPSYRTIPVAVKELAESHYRAAIFPRGIFRPFFCVGAVGFSADHYWQNGTLHVALNLA